MSRRTRSRLAMFVAAAPLALVLFGTTGCRTLTEWSVAAVRKGDLITYEQYLSVSSEANPKLSVDDVINILGQPNDMHDRDGSRIRLDYLCLSLNDELKRAEFHFDKTEHLVKKDLW